MSDGAGPSAYLGIDLGTSGLKLSLVGDDGGFLAEAEEPYDVRAPAAGRAESDPADWAAALHSAGRRIHAARADGAPPVRAVGVTGQMHGVVLTDVHGDVIRPAMLWPDQRAADMLPRWRALAPVVRARLGNPLVAGMAGPLLDWLREHEPAALDAACLVTSPKDWLRQRLTGDRCTERSDASATLLWDLLADDWSSEALSLAGIGREALPALVDSDAIVGTTSEPLARGDAGTAVPVVAGAADTAAALVALRATQADGAWRASVVVNAGTGIQVVRPDVSVEARVDRPTHLYADADGSWYEMLAVQNGGMALAWVQAALGVRWHDLLALARTASAGAGGAVFTPFLSGERGGVAPPSATAGWSSLTSATLRPELARSAFESFAFTIRRGIDLLGGASGAVLLSGGAARDPWLRQLVADVLDRPVSHVRVRSASAVGAAVLAARGVGADLPVPADVIEVVPGRQDRDRLDEAYARWVRAVGA